MENQFLPNCTQCWTMFTEYQLEKVLQIISLRGAPAFLGPPWVWRSVWWRCFTWNEIIWETQRGLAETASTWLWDSWLNSVFTVFHCHCRWSISAAWNLLKPFLQIGLSREERIFKCRLSCAWCSVENALVLWPLIFEYFVLVWHLLFLILVLWSQLVVFYTTTWDINHM
jgi:hypothetical protein